MTEGKELDPDRKERVLADITPENERRAQQAKQVFANFTEYVRERPAVAGAETAADD